jgi:hypothetical protein
MRAFRRNRSNTDIKALRERVMLGAGWDDGFELEKTPLYDLDSVVDTDQLATLVMRRVHGGTIAVTYVSREYLQIGLNWVTAMHRIGWNNYIVVAGDSETEARLSAVGVSCILARIPEGSAQSRYLSQVGFTRRGLAMTALKFPVVSAILRMGVDVFLSDADATWLQDPRASITPGADVAFQRVFYYPAAIARRWSFAACSGFAFFRSSRRSIALIDDCIRIHRTVQSDQVALNLALLDCGTCWMLPAGYDESSEGDFAREQAKEFFKLAATIPILGRTGRHRLFLFALPHNTFWRHAWVPFDPDELVLCHPNTPKEDNAKVTRCGQLGVRYWLGES